MYEHSIAVAVVEAIGTERQLGPIANHPEALRRSWRRGWGRRCSPTRQGLASMQCTDNCTRWAKLDVAGSSPVPRS